MDNDTPFRKKEKFDFVRQPFFNTRDRLRAQTELKTLIV